MEDTPAGDSHEKQALIASFNRAACRRSAGTRVCKRALIASQQNFCRLWGYSSCMDENLGHSIRFMKHSRRTALFVPLFLVQSLSPIALRAQVDRTAITGTVTDQQGNRIPQSTVRATGNATGFQRETLTTSQGTYELAGLPPGVYSVQFVKAGFAPFTAQRVEQTVG